MHTARRAVAALGVAAAAGLVLAAPAVAEPPLEMAERVVDRSTDQVVAGDIEEILTAADDVVAGTDYDLWTVYVDSFDGMRPVEWANDTAVASGANTDVLLLAISVEDREIGLSVAEEAALSDADISDIEAAARSEAREADWVGASVEAARAVIEIGTGVAPPTTGPDEGGETSGGGGALGWLIGILLLGALVLAVLARARRARTDAAATQQPQPTGPPTPEQQWAALSTAELGTRAGSALVALDNDVRSSANEQVG
ncbi:TPM domain-containing protein, partial [Pseudactinotalea suaedae]